MKIGLFFGSFNPVHVGHMIIGNFMVEHTELSQVWMVVTPHNPHKKKSSLANDYERLHMVNIAIGDNQNLRSSDIEFKLPKPSYTIDTLIYLKEKYPQYEFVLIMGGDNLATFHKWKNYEIILRDYEVYVYKRPAYPVAQFGDHPKVHTFDAPLMEISASFIRKCLKEKRSIQYLVPDTVYDYISGSNLYQ